MREEGRGKGREREERGEKEKGRRKGVLYEGGEGGGGRRKVEREGVEEGN